MKSNLAARSAICRSFRFYLSVCFYFCLKLCIKSSSTMTQTRQQSICPVLGHPNVFPNSQLPSRGDVLRHYLYIYSHLPNRNTSTVNEIVDKVSDDLIGMWSSSSVPTQQPFYVKKCVKELYQHYQLKVKHWLSRNKEKKQGSDQWNEFVHKYKEEYSRLLDIAACQNLALNCSCRVCKSMVPDDLAFLTDQRTARIQYISNSSDPSGTKVLHQNIARSIETDRRKLKEQERIAKHNALSSIDNREQLTESSDETDEDTSTDFISKAF